MQHFLARLVIAGCLLVAQSMVLAAPKSLTVTYEATRNGQPFATVTETFRQQGNKYRIESETRGIGVYALFGVRRLVSEGEVGSGGLKPLHFESHQGSEAKRSLFADFDWPANRLNMKVKGKPVTAELMPGTQDIASLIYQFMFVQPKGATFKLPVTTGKRLKQYEYRVASRDEPLTVPAGSFRTIHLQEAQDSRDEDSKELWLGDATVYFLPVRLMTRDDKGEIEQVLTGLHAE
ncbi:MAG TPA: DUF3108 domain-containing protein [Methylophilaceae bacterium]|jgi:hypothetical protein